MAIDVFVNKLPAKIQKGLFIQPIIDFGCTDYGVLYKFYGRRKTRTFRNGNLTDFVCVYVCGSTNSNWINDLSFN